MRLDRPYIPLAVRLQVAERQFRERFGAPTAYATLGRKTLGERLQALLGALFPEGRHELHHRPALTNRPRRQARGKMVYDPPANDPDHLVYLAEDDHDVETRVRGVGAQRSDLGQRRYLKRVAKNRENQKARNVVADAIKRGGAHIIAAKRKWPSRPFPKRSKT